MQRLLMPVLEYIVVEGVGNDAVDVEYQASKGVDDVVVGSSSGERSESWSLVTGYWVAVRHEARPWLAVAVAAENPDAYVAGGQLQARIRTSLSPNDPDWAPFGVILGRESPVANDITVTPNVAFSLRFNRLTRSPRRCIVSCE